MGTMGTDSMDVRPVGGLIGAEIRGVDLRRELDDAMVAEIKDVLHRHGVVFFTGQDIEPEHHRALAARLGPVRMPHAALNPLEGYPEISVISTENGQAYLADHWHTDVSWTQAPPRYSVLHMQTVPPAGGDTAWSSQHLAYEALSPTMQAMLDGLTAHHRIHPTRPEQCADHPVVITHPATGRKALFVNDLFTVKINELTDSESAAVLGVIQANAVRPEFICRWRWTRGDIAIWDNHFVQHYAICDYGAAPRKIHRVEAAPEPPSC
jgi:taurine dioxygenase